MIASILENELTLSEIVLLSRVMKTHLKCREYRSNKRRLIDVSCRKKRMATYFSTSVSFYKINPFNDIEKMMIKSVGSAANGRLTLIEDNNNISIRCTVSKSIFNIEKIRDDYYTGYITSPYIAMNGIVMKKESLHIYKIGYDIVTLQRYNNRRITLRINDTVQYISDEDIPSQYRSLNMGEFIDEE